MPSGGVVPAFYEVEDGGAGLLAGVVGVAVEQFSFQGGEERFCYRIFVGLSSASHGGDDPDFLAAVPERPGRILLRFKGSSQHTVGGRCDRRGHLTRQIFGADRPPRRVGLLPPVT